MSLVPDLLGGIRVTGAQILFLLIPSLGGAFLMHLVARRLERETCALVGGAAYRRIFGWLGTAVHELGHAMMCVPFGHRILGIKLFHWDPDDGSLGYVQHSYNRRNPYHVAGNFFIGIGPIIVGTASTLLISGVFLPDVFHVLFIGAKHVSESIISGQTQTPIDLFGAWFGLVRVFSLGVFAWNNCSDWRFYVFLYFLVAIGGGSKLSRSDFEAAGLGIGLFVVTLFVEILLGALGVVPFMRLRAFVTQLFVMANAAMLCTLLVNSSLVVVLTFARLVFQCVSFELVRK